MAYRKYEVKFLIDWTVIADSAEDAQEIALEQILEWNGYWVRDFINHKHTKFLWEPTKEEIEEIEN